ncbi:MAG: protein kinase [Terriglobales bacterium]
MGGDSALTGSLVGRFRVGECLGSGGMGEIFRAEDTRLHRVVALKRIAPALEAQESYRERFLHEAQRASQLSHPHVAAIYDVIEHGPSLFLVMEYIEGETLRQRMRLPISVSEIVQIAVQCAEGLEAAHAAGILHGDIKPENIMLARASGSSVGPADAIRAKILDFGVAKVLPGTGPDTPTYNVTSELSGTPEYMAPEMLLGRLGDARADIFSLGVVVYELLAGNNPFRAATVFASAERILNDKPSPLDKANPRVTPELAAIVDKMLAKDPQQRYPSVGEALSDLRGLAGLSETRRMPVGSFAVSRSLRNVALAVLVIGVILGLALGVYRLRAPHSHPAVPAPAEQSIVVLPFSVAGEDANLHALSGGLSEAIADKLTQLSPGHALQVVSPSVVHEQNVTSADQAHKMVGADLVLSGELSADGKQIRARYRLEDAVTHHELHGGKITADAATDPFALEDQIVENVVTSLSIDLQAGGRQALAARHTSSPQAYDHFLQGRGYLEDFQKPENVDRAIQAFQRARELDPGFALAYAGLGKAAWYKHDITNEPHLMENAQENCKRAVALDDSAEDAHTCLGMVFQRKGEYGPAVQELQKAVQLAPYDFDAYRFLADAYAKQNQLAEAEETYRKAISLHPGSWSGYNALGTFYYHNGRNDEAIEMFQKELAITPDNFRALNNLGGTYLAKGDIQQAILFWNRSNEIRPNGDALSNLGSAYFFQREFVQDAATLELAVKMYPSNSTYWVNLGEAYYFIAGKEAEAHRTLDRALELIREDLRINPRDTEMLVGGAHAAALRGDRRLASDYLRQGLAIDPQNANLLFEAALVHQLSGETDAALAGLEKARAAGYPAEYIKGYPAFDGLKENPRFQKLIGK